jgi:hypothetical protein
LTVSQTTTPKSNSFVIFYVDETENGVAYVYSVTATSGNIVTDPQTGSETGSVRVTVPGWEDGETITVTVTGTSPVLAPVTATSVWVV